MDIFRRFFRDNPLTAASVVTVVIVLPSFLAWLQTNANSTEGLGIYEIFPLLGLLAFSLMLAHVLFGACGVLLRLDMSRVRNYYRYTGYAVLACILLHPGLFIWQLYQDGYGLPPNSYLTFVDAGLRVFVLLGGISLVIFLLFESKRKYGDRSWWFVIERASDVALILVFIHGLFLGSQTQAGWFRVVWIVYGVILLVCLAYAFTVRHRLRKI